jgi:putative Holliday junction resolvase
VNLATLLCFDFGSKRIGVAVGQTVTGTASPLLTINSLNNKPDWKRIEGVISDWRPDAIIVGMPLTMHGTTQVMTEAAERFARQIEGRFHIPVYHMDERLSTFEARERAGDNADLDAVAAQAILESWMHDNCDELADTPDHNETEAHAGL